MAADPSLEVHFTHQLGTLNLNVDFTTSAPWSVLFGSSGSGKSTILRAIAGVLRPDEGRIVIGGQVVFDSQSGIWIPAHQRPMRWAAQRAMLYPWKTVEQNLAMSVEPVERVIRHFGLVGLTMLRPDQLSGGQRQKIGVVRAAAGSSDKRLLLDEPFTGLDAAIRDRLIRDLRGWIGDSSVLSVTHDVEEAFLLKAEVIRIENGHVVAQGPVDHVLAEERVRVLGVLAPPPLI